MEDDKPGTVDGRADVLVASAPLRGRCHELSLAHIEAHPDHRLVRGWYHCPIWGREEHWWTVGPDGTIHDPTAAQFPSGGLGEYEEYRGLLACEQCGREVAEDEALHYGRFHFCSDTCIIRCCL